MPEYTINYSVARVYQAKGGKLMDGFETEFVVERYGTTHTVRTKDQKVETIRAAIDAKLKELDAVHELGSEE